MANTPSATKRAKQAETRRQHNVALRSRMRTAVKKTRSVLAGGDATATSEALKLSAVAVDKGVTKGLIHPNKAARHKSRTNKAIKALRQKG